MMISNIDHIGIAVASIDEAVPLYRDVLGLEYAGKDTVDEQGVEVAFFRCGETMIELLEATREDSPIAKFVAKRGPGIHHIALRTDDLDGAREHVGSRSIRLLSDEPLDGAHGKLISFMHPKDTLGVLLELTQRKREGE